MNLRRMQNKYALHIPINTCGPGLSIAHVGPIIINVNCKIGANAVVNKSCEVIGTTLVGIPEIAINKKL